MKAHIVSLGCPKNLTDTESLMGQLAQEGYSFTDDHKEAIETIKGLAKYKKKGKCKYLIAAGCLPQRYKHECPKLLPEVDAFIGTPRKFPGNSSFVMRNSKFIKATPPWFAYVKIAEGCNNRCAYCAVPKIRGPLKIRPVKDIINEAKLLAKAGVKEIIYVAQDTTVHPELPKILRQTARIKQVKWIRLMYAHPAHVTDELDNVIAKEKKVLKYLDLPSQHASDKILELMKRRYERLELENLISKIRRKIPNLALRTSVIVGFPGEGETEFNELLAFIKQVKFDRLGCFTYSREPETPAYKMRGQVSNKVKQARLDKVMRLQARISRDQNKKMIGRTLDIIIERSSPAGYIGRSYMDAPDIDGPVTVRSTKSLKPGQIIKTRIAKAGTYDLSGFMP